MLMPRIENRHFRRLGISLGVFLPIFTGCYVAAFLLRFAGEPTDLFLSDLLATLPFVLSAKLAVALWFRLHQGWSRYVTFHDMLVVAQAVSCSSIAITLADALAMSQLTIPRSVILLDWGAAFVALCAARALPRLIRDGGWSPRGAADGIRALIVGANDSGEAILRALRRSQSPSYNPIGFVDDRTDVQGWRISGIPVVGQTADVAKLADELDIAELLITSGELPGKEVRKLLEMAGDRDFRVKVLPSYEQLLREDVTVRPRSVAIEDLLRRPSVELDLDGIRNWLAGRTLLVTGSAGSIGAEICRQLIDLNPGKLILLDRSETGQFYIDRELRRGAPHVDIKVAMADITDYERTATIFRQYRPDVIFHAAAYKHVPLMEAHPGEAVKNIALATRNLVDLADEYDASGLVMISTDKAVNPTSVMGSCKRLAEHYVQARATVSACRMVTVRFGNVLDSAGSVVPVFREQIARGGPVTVTHPDMIRYFMLIPEAAQLVIQAGAMGQGGEIFVLDMSEPVRIVDLAHDLIRLSGLRVGEDIEVEFVGLRPGEKLYEELYGDGEDHELTTHPKIMVAASKSRPLLEVIHDMNRLAEIADQAPDVVKQTLRDIVPVQTAPSITQPSRRAA